MEQQAYAGMARAEDEHWWYVARRRLVERVLTAYLPTRQNTILEIGCGCDGNLTMLAAFGRVHAMEPHEESRALAENRGAAEVRLGSIDLEWPYEMDFDLVCLFDVLEHVDDDLSALIRVQHALKPGGQIILTVPAYKLLWSDLDEVAHHKRRYTRSSLMPKMRTSGFTPRYTTYFNTILFPPILAARLIQRHLPRPEPQSHFDVPGKPLNAALRALFSLENAVIPHVSLPFGVSLLVLATRGAE